MVDMWVDNETAGLERAWYAVALSGEVQDAPVGVRVLGREWVVVRLADGLAAFEDRCPHRLAPLSIGTVCGATLQCRYHGWELDRTGACVRIPALGDDSAIPTKARAATPFGVVERYGLVWLAPEEPVCDLPDFPEWDDPAFDTCWNEPRSTSAGAIQLTDNFLDATHLPTVHTTTFGVEDGTYLPPHEVTRDGWTASTTYVAPYRNHDDPLVATGEHPLVQEHHLFKEFSTATTALIRLRFPMTGGVLAILFSCLPEGNGASKVFKMMARNDFAGDRTKIDESIAFEDRVMDEDLAVLESYRHTAVPLDTRVEVHTRNDKLGLAYRRVLAELVGAASD
ncbi:MAG: putative oxidoreductase, Rieske [2Fe-2S] region [Actinomycetia bacterium]|nr:putative oxidoreductase, Rieske [2Fe-2S] region [Actinomycetes bacterium]